MPQEMNVLCCYSCKMYQVHIVKKAPKWNCKLCNAKQSVQQIYFQGSGRDCRLHVQQLNAMKANNTFFISSEQDDACDTFANIPEESASDNTENKWTKYFESSETEDLVFDKKTDDITPDDTDSENEDVNNETKELCSMSFNRNSCIDDSCDMPDNTKSNGDHINAVNIFETYDELDDPLDL
ncbi:MRN complex-interacting protein [Formica exsecta]|uniref:MRN complex-interacting protein n=1 Tax=Formica exsecta TaxID=72781 RepID=UPI001141D0B8|nr:MRN complex-interacting protein [Formica exsecta]